MMSETICLAPKRVFEPPAFVVPDDACDCHAHVIAVGDARYPLVADRSYAPQPASPRDYLDMLDRLGMRRGVLVQVSVHGTDNRYMLAVLRGHGERLRGVAVADPAVGDAELSEMHAAGVRGLRINTLFGGGVGLETLQRLAARIAPLGWHMQLLIDIRTLPALLPQLRALPCPCVVDHFGHQPAGLGPDSPGFQALLELVSGHGWWVKLSGAYRISAMPGHDDVLPLARRLAAAAPDRLVWGSDWPHVAVAPMPDTGHLLNLLARWVPDADTRRRILVDNPAILYQFQ